MNSLLMKVYYIFKCITFILVTFLIFVVVYNFFELFVIRSRDPTFLYSQTREFQAVRRRQTICHSLNYNISEYYKIINKYPKDTSELHLIPSGGSYDRSLYDPLTYKIMEFEVCDSLSPDKWYRTIDISDSTLPIWLPDKHNGIYKVRPAYNSKAEEIDRKYMELVKKHTNP